MPFIPSPLGAPPPGVWRDPFTWPGGIPPTPPFVPPSPFPPPEPIAPSREPSPGGTPRPPRPPRPPRAKRPPRPPRPPRKPRKNGTLNEDQECFCGYHRASGTNAHFGSPLRVRRGAALPPSAPGTGWRKARCGFACSDDDCEGPLAPALKAALAVFGISIAPQLTPAQIVRLNDKADQLARRHLRPRHNPNYKPKFRVIEPIVSDFCCICGAVGGCLCCGGTDCRKLPVLQRSKGQC